MVNKTCVDFGLSQEIINTEEISSDLILKKYPKIKYFKIMMSLIRRSWISLLLILI